MTRPTYLFRQADAWIDTLLADVPGVMLTGPRGCGKTTTALRHSASVLRMDVPSERVAMAADPDGLLRDCEEPVLVDEWQLEPDSLAAAKRLIDEDPAPGRFLFTGSIAAELSAGSWPGTGRFVRVPLWGLTQSEIAGRAGSTFLDGVLDGALERGLKPENDHETVADYVDRALASGFPEGLRRSSHRTRSAWLDSYVDHIVGRDASLIGELRDPARLRLYLRAIAANTAGCPDLTSLLSSTGLNRETALRYDRFLERLFITDQVPAWSTNRVRRIVGRPKRYVCDPAIAAGLLGVDRRTVLRDGDLLGRIIDTFVAAELRAQLPFSDQPMVMYHLRQQAGRHEIDLLVERADGAVVAIEVKASASIDVASARHLEWLRDELDARQFAAGLVLYSGRHLIRLGDRVWGVPISCLWSTR